MNKPLQFDGLVFDPDRLMTSLIASKVSFNRLLPTIMLYANLADCAYRRTPPPAPGPAAGASE